MWYFVEHSNGCLFVVVRLDEKYSIINCFDFMKSTELWSRTVVDHFIRKIFSIPSRKAFGQLPKMGILMGQILRLESGFEACKSLASLLMLFQFNNVSLVNSFIDVIKINLIYHKSNYEWKWFQLKYGIEKLQAEKRFLNRALEREFQNRTYEWNWHDFRGITWYKTNKINWILMIGLLVAVWL